MVQGMKKSNSILNGMTAVTLTSGLLKVSFPIWRDGTTKQLIPGQEEIEQYMSIRACPACSGAS